MGYSKKLYNVLGGVTSSIIPFVSPFAYPQTSQILQIHHTVFVHFYQCLTLQTGLRTLPVRFSPSEAGVLRIDAKPFRAS